MNNPPARARVAFVCDTCGTLVLPIMGCEHMTLPDGSVWSGHARESCLPERGRFRSWIDSPKPAETDAEREQRWRTRHEGRPALPLNRTHDAFTHRAHDRRPETPANPAAVKRGVTETSIMTRTEEALEVLRLERERALVEHPACDETPVRREPFWAEAHTLIRGLERGEAMRRLMGGERAVQQAKAAIVAAYHTKSGRLIAIRVACRDGRREVTFTDTGEMIREDTPPMQAQLDRRIAKSGAYLRTVYARTPDWTGDDLKGDGFVHLGTHVLNTSDV